jgi:hypothetical protein
VSARSLQNVDVNFRKLSINQQQKSDIIPRSKTPQSGRRSKRIHTQNTKIGTIESLFETTISKNKLDLNDIKINKKFTSANIISSPSKSPADTNVFLQKRVLGLGLSNRFIE